MDLANCSTHVAPLLKWWPPFAYGALGMRSGFSMKSGGVLASPANTNALPGSDKLVPKTTMPENRDCAAAQAGVASTSATQPTSDHRTSDVDLRSVFTMTCTLSVVGSSTL